MGILASELRFFLVAVMTVPIVYLIGYKLGLGGWEIIVALCVGSLALQAIRRYRCSHSL